MRNMKKALAILLTTVMLVSSLTLGIFAAETATVASTGNSNEQYFYKYTFDDLATAKRFQGGLWKLGNTGFNSNPLSLSNDGAVIADIAADSQESSNKYLRIDYTQIGDDTGTGSYYCLRPSLYEPATDIDHFIANGVSVSFKFRWVGTDEECKGQTVNFFRMRRKISNIDLINGTVDSNGDFVLSALTPSFTDGKYTVVSTPVYTFKKDSKNFSNIEIKYHDAFSSYSLYIDGTPIIEEAYIGTDTRTTSYITTEYDNDYMATSRKSVNHATLKVYDRAFEMFRITNTTIKHAIVFDIDDFIIKEDTVAEDRVYYYRNTFDTYYSANAAVKQYNGFSNQIITNATYKIQGTAANLVHVYDATTKKGYLDFGAKTRLDLLDVHQLIQDGSWTVSFDIQATNSSTTLQTVIGLYDGSNSPKILWLDNEGYLYVGDSGKVKLTGAKIPKYGTDEWANVKLSVFYTNENEGTFYDFVLGTGTGAVAKRGYAVYVNDELIGVHTGGDVRNEVISSGSTIINAKYTKAAISAEPTSAELAGYTLVEDTGTRKTWENASGHLYQVKYDGNGAFLSGVKVTLGSKSTGDTLSFFRQDNSTNNAKIDNIEVYSGIGNPKLATGKSDTKGVIGEVEFAKQNLTSSATGMTNTTPANGGGYGIFKLADFSADTATVVSETDANGKSVSYINLDSGSASAYAEMSADHSGGKIFAADMTLRKVSGASADFFLFRLRRQTETESSAAFLDILKYSKSKGCVIFTYNGATAYLCDAGGRKVTLTGDEWTTLRMVIDESGEAPLVTFYVNGKIACYTTDTNLVPLKAAELTGMISASITNRKNAIDQRVRFFETYKTAVNFDLLDAKIEYAEAPKGVGNWADEAAVDFSKINDLSELGEQFLISDGCYLENGALVVPDGETFGWVDYNGVFANFLATNAVDPTCPYRINCGFSVEAELKSGSDSGQGLFMVTSHATENQTIVFKQSGKLLMSGGAESGYVVQTPDSDRFSAISATYTLLDTTKAIFADGKLAGVVGWSGNNPTLSDGNEKVAFMFADDAVISKVYVHADQKRTLAENSGVFFELDPNVFLPKDSSRYPGMGIWEDKQAYSTKATQVKNDGDFNYFRFNFVETADEVTSTNGGHVLTAQTRSDVQITDYLEDKVSVFEYDIRLTRHPSATGKRFGLAKIRRTEDGSTGATSLTENILVLNDKGNITICDDYYLCNADGTLYQMPDAEWINLAAIYDANAGLVSYVVGGEILYYCNGEGKVLGLAQNIQLSNQRLYRMDAADTKLIIVDVNKGFFGMLDVAGIKMYNIDGTANSGYVGVQRDTANSNIRLVAGTDMLYYGRVGFEVEAYDANGNKLSSVSKKYTDNIVYSSIKETVYGAVKTAYPEEYGYRYFYTASITGIPQDKAVRLNVTPFTVTNGVQYNASTVTLDIDFTSTSMNNWKLDSNSVEIKPEGDNINANFSTTDIVRYTNDGALELNGLGAKFAFAADLEGGVVSVNLTNAKGEVSENSVFDVYVDGKLAKEGIALAFGHHTLVLAENLTGEHEFMIVKRSGGDFVCINNMSVCGALLTSPELATEGAVYVEVLAPASDKKYGDVHVYVRTSDPSEKYYIRYHFVYKKVATNSYNYFTGKASTGNNSDLYRIIEAHLVEKNTDGSFTTLFGVLQSGEVSLAIKEKHLFTVEELAAAGKTDSNGNAYTKATNIAAPDFVGGFHGDELMESVAFYLDGELLDTTKAGNYDNVTHFEFCQDTIINRCDEEDEDVMRHIQNVLLDTNGLRLNQHVEFLCNDFYPANENTYLQMCTLYRVNTSLGTTAEKADPDNYVCADIAIFDANGKKLFEEDLRKDIYSYNPSLGTTNVNIGKDTQTQNRYIEYYGNNNGLYGKAGFIIPDASVMSDRAILAVRRGQGDNKWYASFDTYNGAAPYLGEVWNVNDYYFFDYNTTAITK